MYSRRPKTLEELEREHRRQMIREGVLVFILMLVAVVIIALAEAALGIPTCCCHSMLP